VVAYREQLRGDWSTLAGERDQSTTSSTATDPEALARLAEIFSNWRDEVTRSIDALQANGWIAAERPSAPHPVGVRVRRGSDHPRRCVVGPRMAPAPCSVSSSTAWSSSFVTGAETLQEPRNARM
jgi:hypothetical protein